MTVGVCLRRRINSRLSVASAATRISHKRFVSHCGKAGRKPGLSVFTDKATGNLSRVGRASQPAGSPGILPDWRPLKPSGKEPALYNHHEAASMDIMVLPSAQLWLAMLQGSVRLAAIRIVDVRNRTSF